MENPYEFIRAANLVLHKRRNAKLDKLFNEYVEAEPELKFFIMEKFIIEKMRMN